MKGPCVKKAYDIDDNNGPDLRNLNCSVSSFQHNIFSNTDHQQISTSVPSSSSSTAANNDVIINEVGSVHLSFTCSEGAELFVIWSGHHANVPIDMLPSPGVVPPFPSDEG